MNYKKKILFLCTGNACRSQMAEGWLRALKGEIFEAYSAGLEVHGLNPQAVRVMAEVGVDISRQKSTTLEAFDGVTMDIVITVCDHADENCPVLPSATKKIHKCFDDPPKLAEDACSEKETLDCYRRVRDEIRQFIGSIDVYLLEAS